MWTTRRYRNGPLKFSTSWKPEAEGGQNDKTEIQHSGAVKVKIGLSQANSRDEYMGRRGKDREPENDRDPVPSYHRPSQQNIALIF